MSFAFCAKIVQCNYFFHFECWVRKFFVNRRIPEIFTSGKIGLQ